MNRMNPLYIVAFFVIILLFALLQLSNAKRELVSSKLTYKETLALSTKLVALRTTYSDKVKVKKSLNKILSQSSLRQANISKKITSSSVMISSESMQLNALNSLMSKVLNGSYQISKLSIKRLDDEKASFKMVIKW